MLVPTTFSSEQVKVDKNRMRDEKTFDPEMWLRIMATPPSNSRLQNLHLYFELRLCRNEAWRQVSSESHCFFLLHFALSHAGWLTRLPSVLLSTQTYCSSKDFGSSALSIFQLSLSFFFSRVSIFFKKNCGGFI